MAFVERWLHPVIVLVGKGIQFEEAQESVPGDKMSHPLQKFHWSQIEILFRARAIWQHEPLKSAIEAL
jgi:hypothetical protein